MNIESKDKHFSAFCDAKNKYAEIYDERYYDTCFTCDLETLLELRNFINKVISKIETKD